MYHTYVLLSQKDGGLYIGYAHDIYSRFHEHEGGGVESTKHRRPLILFIMRHIIFRRMHRIVKDFLKVEGEGNS